MTYLFSLIFNFFFLFLVVHFAPGLIAPYSASSPIGPDLLFAAIVGSLNASVFSFLLFLDILPTRLKLAAVNGIISFGSFILMMFIPFGFQPDAGGVASGGAIAWLLSFVSNYLEMRRWIEKHKK